MATTEEENAANALKEEGNRAIQSKKFDLAIEKYSEAIGILPENHVFYSNRSHAYLETKNSEKALEDAEMCINILPSFYKGYYRKAMALAAMERYSDAEQVFECGMEQCPSQKQALRKELKVMKEQARRKNKQRAQSTSSRSAGVPSNAHDAWANGLSTADQYEWLSNCYQMRCDDDYAWGGCYLHGPYNPEATLESIKTDFIAFCLLAKRRGVVPAGWDWSAFLKAAANHVVFAFEKSDAKERWGGENVFSAMMGGRSLRYTAEIVYGSNIQAGETSPEAEQALDDAETENESVLNEIGGSVVWNHFVADVGRTSRFAGE